MADSQTRLVTKYHDVNVSETWNVVLEDDLPEVGLHGEQKEKSGVVHTVVTINEPPPSYKPSEKTSNSSIKCEVCQSVVSLKGREDHKMINCSVCFADTPLRPAKCGFKYVRCLCNHTQTIPEYRTRYLCSRTNCRRLVKLGPANSIEATQHYSLSMLKCHQCQKEFFTTEPSSREVFTTCPICKAAIGEKPTYINLSLFCLIVGLVCWLGGVRPISDHDNVNKTIFWVLWGSCLNGLGVGFLALALCYGNIARRSGIAQTMHWEDLGKDDFKLLDEKLYFMEDDVIQKKQHLIKVAHPAVAPIVDPDELPPSNTACARTDNAWIKCEGCQSEMSLKGREDHRMINCSVCFEDTPLRPAKPGSKYARCWCNRLEIHSDSCKGSFICTRPNCKRLVKWGLDNSIQATKHYRYTKYRCCHCQRTFINFEHSSRIIHVKCPTCNIISSIRPTYTYIRALFFGLLGSLCGSGPSLMLFYGFHSDMGLAITITALYFVGACFVKIAFDHENISHIVGHHESLEEKSESIG